MNRTRTRILGGASLAGFAAAATLALAPAADADPDRELAFSPTLVALASTDELGGVETASGGQVLDW